MINFFKRKKPIKTEKDESLYNVLLKSEEENSLVEIDFSNLSQDGRYRGEFEIEILKGRKLNREDSTKLNEAVLKFYERESDSVNLICDFFKDKRAIEVFSEFESFIFSLDIFEEKRLAGLSILLMRDTRVIEAIKFGIMLAHFYPLVNYPAAVKIIVNLGIYPEFTYYSLGVLKQLNYYELVRDNILRRGLKETQIIEENME
ncbi:hypothetical protein [Anaerosphaera multitolerans]|uniref:Uncharacterized protein n=1 Tax=Anaerosphaera multitolerans TaxID=2487351 RepID=A0A437S6B2_9FIRM|nr:hypothetical protein [Anaerosphaera multitolerans]RVU54537.1 hypothetical protein EF514_07220 [Anaerosphaera multitolerans]